MARPKPELVLSAGERDKLATWAGRPESTRRLALRARIILACADDPSNQAVAVRLGVCGAAVGTRRPRFVAGRLGGPTDEPRPGAPRPVADADAERVVTRTLESEPANPAHGSTRGMAEAAGLSQPAVGRVRRAFGLEPHRHETFRPSTDPDFVEKVRDVVGLYLAPPERALVPSVHERGQVQALDRTRPVLPMTPGQAERGTHDDARHGTASPLAALGVATGRAIGTCRRRHRHREFVRSLDHLDATPAEGPGASIRPVLDDDATHETPAVKAWLPRHPEYHPHFTPASGSWPNRVERFVAEIAGGRIRRGVFRGVPALEEAITDHLAEHDADPEPFARVADADSIPDRIKKVCDRTSDSGH